MKNMTNGYGFSGRAEKHSPARGGYSRLLRIFRIMKYAVRASAVTIIQLINWNSIPVLRARFFELSRRVKQKPAADNQGDPQNELKNHHGHVWLPAFLHAAHKEISGET